MQITLSLKEFSTGVLVIAIAILIIYIALFFRSLIMNLKNTNKILQNVEGMTKILEKRTNQIDGVVDNVTENMEKTAEALESESLLKQISNIATAVNLIFKIATGKTKDKKKIDKCLEE